MAQTTFGRDDFAGLARAELNRMFGELYQGTSDLEAGKSDTGHAHASGDLSDFNDSTGPQDGYVWTYDAASGAYIPSPQSAASPATESVAGVVEHATEAEVQSGAAGNLVATVQRLRAELDRRTSQIGAIDNGPQVFNNITVTTTVVKSSDLRGVGGVPADAKGIWYLAFAGVQTSTSQVGVASADVMPGTSQRVAASANEYQVAAGMAKLGTTVGNEGKVAVAQLGGAQTTSFFMWITGWWS